MGLTESERAVELLGDISGLSFFILVCLYSFETRVCFYHSWRNLRDPVGLVDLVLNIDPPNFSCGFHGHPRFDYSDDGDDR